MNETPPTFGTGPANRRQPKELVNAAVAAAGPTMELFGEATIPVLLISLGTALVAMSTWARFDDPQIWGSAEFLGLLIFGALLALLGSAERIALLRTGAVRTSTTGSDTTGQTASFAEAMHWVEAAHESALLFALYVNPSDAQGLATRLPRSHPSNDQ